MAYVRDVVLGFLSLSALAAGVVFYLASYAVARAMRRAGIRRRARRDNRNVLRVRRIWKRVEARIHADGATEDFISWSHRPTTGRHIMANELPLADRLEFADALEALDEADERKEGDECKD